ncbi:MAG: helix-turn-helix domain-containing protein [Candidatus Kuenenbacteria bacterium]
MPKHFNNIQLSTWVIMPNHIHGIIEITNVGTGQRSLSSGQTSPVQPDWRNDIRTENTTRRGQRKPTILSFPTRTGQCPVPTSSNIMHTQIFQEIGLTPNEAKIYQTLIEEGETTVGLIALKGKIHRRNVYDAINRLIEKGLVFQILTKGENIYKAVDPAKLLELIKEKEDKLKKILPDLQKQYKSTPRGQEAFVYRGVEGFKNYLRDILRVASEGEDKNVYFIGAKGLWLDPKLKTFLKSFLSEAGRLGIKYHYIFDSEVKEMKNILDEEEEVGTGQRSLSSGQTSPVQYDRCKDSGTGNTIARTGQRSLSSGQTSPVPTYKFFPPEYSTKACIDIFGDHIVTFTGLGPGKIDEDIAIYVLIDDVLADGYRTWFEFMWDNIQ